MKRAALIRTFAFACLIGSTITLAQLKPQSDAKKLEASPACPFSIIERSHKVLEMWRERVEKHRLPSDDPYLNAMELFKSAAENINTCRKEAKLRTLDRAALDDLASRNQPLQRPIEYIRALRKKNNELHIPDSVFPWSWRPMLSSPH